MKSNGLKTKMCLILIVFLMYCSFSVLGAPAREVAQQSEKIPHRVPKVKGKIRVDGVLDDAIWKQALKLELKYEVHPGENIEPPVRTEIFLAYSNSHFYVGFKAYDHNPPEIRATIHDRDNLGTDDWLAIIIDPFNDSRRTYDFFCTPLGIQADIIESPGGGVTQWDAIWKSAGKVTDWGYGVEMAIPFSSLRFQRKKGDQTWGFDAVRCYPRNVRHLIGLFSRDRNNNCYMCQSEKLIGFGGISKIKNFEIDPTLSGHLTQERESFPNGQFEKKDSKVDPGITARWNFTPNMTLSATANPDFSNVEADVAQLDINKQFALFYPEKRPFFLEGASLFNTIYNVIHTRSLADPNGGIKITGKEGPHAIGFFSVHDNLTNLIIPGSQNSAQTFLPINTLGTAVRYRRDIGKASNIGIVMTDREGDDYYNRVAGIDGNLRLSRKDRVLFQFLGSQTSYPGDINARFGQPMDPFTGGGLDILYSHNTKTFNWFLDYQQLSPDFRADLGFIAQVDYRHINGGLSHVWRRNPGSWFTTIGLTTSYQLEKDFDDNLLYKTFSNQLNYAGPLQSVFALNCNIGKRSFMGIVFDENFFTGGGRINPSKTIVLQLTWKLGDEIDFTNVQPGKVLLISPNAQVKFGTHLTMDLGHDYERLNVDGGRLYTANLTNLKLVYQFNKRTFLRTIMQYANHKFNAELYPFPINPKYQQLFTQILFSYKINPQTVLFIGYSDDYYGFQGINLTQNNRTAFVKIGYALVL